MIKIPKSNRLKISTLFLILSSLTACGGSDSGNDQSSYSWVKNEFQSETLFKNKCASPRPGSIINPYTDKPYPDAQGSLADEKHWVRSWNNDVYLWYDEVEDQDPALFSTPVEYFQKALRTLATTPSGQAKDHFSSTIPTEKLNRLIQSGVSSGYGAKWVIKTNTATGSKGLYVLYSEPESPAAIQELVRGAKVIEVDGINLATFSTEAERNTINNGLTPRTLGETHRFKILDANSSTTRTISMTSEDVAIDPVPKTHILSNGTAKVGYLLFNTHIMSSANALIESFDYFKQNNINDLILDLRYNGGGAVTIATLVASLISGDNTTNGKIFMKSVMNDKHPTIDPFSGEKLKPRYFYTSNSDGTALPRLGLRRVYVLTGANTCSSSELVMNGLDGVGVEVIQIGDTTCGKPYGFVPVDNCSNSYLTINFKGTNNKGLGDYSDGFTPLNGTGIRDIGIKMKGCVAPDDLTQPLGNSSEKRIASALYYRDNGSCPDFTEDELKFKKVETTEEIIESKWLHNAIVTPNNLGFK